MMKRLVAIIFLTVFVACEKNNAPIISVLIPEVNVIGGVEAKLSTNQLILGDQVVISWEDENLSTCKITLSFTSEDGVSKGITPGAILNEAGLLEITIIDDEGISSSVSIVLNATAIYGLESLAQLKLHVDEEVDLSRYVSVPDNLELIKAEIVTDGLRTEIDDPSHFNPEYPGQAVFVFSLQRKDGSIVSVESSEFTIFPLSMPWVNIPSAAISEGWEGVSTGYQYYSTKSNFEVTGVFKAWALLREIIAHGTRDASATEIKIRLLRHQPVIYGEHPKAIDTLHWFSGSGANWKEEQMIVHFDEECRFLCPDISDKIRNDWQLFGDSHGLECTGVLYITTYPVLHALGMKIGIVGTQVLVDHEDSAMQTYYEYDRLEEELNWIKSHPETIFYSTASVWSGFLRIYYPQLSIQPNIGILMCALGNVPPNGKYLITKYGEELSEYTVDFKPWSYGADGVIGGHNNGETRAPGTTLLPVESHKYDDDLWCETSDVLGSGGQATSPASPAAMGKFYLASLLNYALNSNLTVQENKRQIREACLDHRVYWEDELYMIGKRVNPGGIVEKYFSTLPSSLNLSSDELVPIPVGVFPNCVVVGPGVVDSQGTPVTSDNYVEMIGKPLFISPVLLRKYGVKAGNNLEYTEHLCLDGEGTGIDNPAEAWKSICSKLTKISIQSN